MSKETCQRCEEKGCDRRTIWMACFYAMDELGLPFNKMSVDGENGRKFFTLLVCKDCRADWMNAIKIWFETKPIRESCGSGIFVRHNGATIEISEEKWRELNPGREPIRVSS